MRQSAELRPRERLGRVDNDGRGAQDIDIRLYRRLTVLAALGIVALMASAVVFHLVRGEGGETLINIALAAVALVVAWGRHARVPIAPRS